MRFKPALVGWCGAWFTPAEYVADRDMSDEDLSDIETGLASVLKVQPEHSTAFDKYFAVAAAVYAAENRCIRELKRWLASRSVSGMSCYSPYPSAAFEEPIVNLRDAFQLRRRSKATGVGNASSGTHPTVADLEFNMFWAAGARTKCLAGHDCRPDGDVVRCVKNCGAVIEDQMVLLAQG
jgi:hypothetical protein